MVTLFVKMLSSWHFFPSVCVTMPVPSKKKKNKRRKNKLNKSFDQTIKESSILLETFRFHFYFTRKNSSTIIRWHIISRMLSKY